MKNIGEQATNKLKIVGKLLDCTFRNGTLKTGSQYESVNFDINANRNSDVVIVNGKKTKMKKRKNPFEL